jgi:hypothetical protein
MRRQYAPLLGGNWDFKSNASPINLLDTASTSRHRFVHAGVEPNIWDADIALQAFDKITKFAKDRLVANLYTFPRTSFALLSESGLRRKNAWTRRMQLLVEEVEGKEGWLESFGRWMDFQPKVPEGIEGSPARRS